MNEKDPPASADVLPLHTSTAFGRWSTLWAWQVWIVYLIWGVGLIYSDAGDQYTVLIGLHYPAEWFGPDTLGALLLISCLAAFNGLLYENRREPYQTLLLLLPQNVLILTALASTQWLIIDGEFMGREQSRILLMMSFATVLAPALCHTLGLIRRYVWP